MLLRTFFFSRLQMDVLSSQGFQGVLSTPPPGTAWERAINFPQLRGRLLLPLDAILMDSWGSPLPGQFGDATIAKDSNY